ncbi:MAG TPA: multicopper oxidase domain-containing protein [Streptosporangiaceae bacterium]
MSSAGSSPRAGSRRFGEAILLALVLSAGLAASTQLTSAILNPVARGSTTGPPGLLITVPLAVLAAWAGLWIASLMDLDGRGWAAALNKAALISLTFTVLTAGFGIGAALISAATGFPMLFAAAFLLGRWRDRHAEDPPHIEERKRRLPLFIYIASAVSLVGFTVSATGMASAGAATTAAAPVTATTNPCATAPHDTFNVSAINVDMPLNRYGVHDPNGFMYVLNSNIAAVRAEEKSQQVSSGLQGGDAIQPLVIRGHEGDCVTVNLTNATTFGVQAMDQGPAPDPADGCNNGTDANGNNNPPVNAAGQCDGALARTAPNNIAWNADGLPGLSANDVSTNVGQNADTSTAPGKTTSYTVYLDPALGEGAHVFHSTGDIRQTQGHGLFGAIISEPKGSQFLDPHTNQPLASGWDATIQMPSGPSFREFALLFHEIGDEGYRQIYEKTGATCNTAEGEVQSGPGDNPAGCELPVVDKFTDAYRPCSKAINYRSECFYEREVTQKNAGFSPDEAQDYGSYTNGDMATPRPELYIGDPYKIRLINAGSEMGHVFHEHGGAIRWLRNPGAANPDIAGGLEKTPPVTKASIRLDSQTIEPGESYSLETECGAGGCQQTAGEFLYHCHIAAHYDSGMVGFIRVFDTAQSDLATVPGRTAKPQAVTSAGLIGKVIEGKTVVPQAQLTNPSTQVSLESLVEGQLPPQGVRLNAQDATVWDWQKSGTATAPIYLGEPEDTHSWANYTAPHPGQRDPIMFDPTNGRYAWPLLQPHLGMRPPFSPNGHSGAPWLGPTASSTRPDGLCPANAPVHNYNITAIQTPILDQSDSGRDASGNPIKPQSDPNGEVFVLNEDKAAVESGAKPAQPLALRSDVGDCLAITLTNELNPSTAGEATTEENTFRKLNIHIHFVQFDTQASDGVITGLSFEQSMRPVTGGEPGETTLTAAAAKGATQISVASTAGLRPGISVEVGQGEVDTEVATKITAINGNTLTLNAPLQNAHASGEPTGVEFVQYRWYSDAQNGTVFFHDHVDALSSWGHGLFGAHIIEPPGSTFHDPVTGALIRSGPSADIYTTGSAGFGEKGDFREFVLWQHTGIRSSGSPQGCEQASFNLRAAPLIDRDPNAADPNNGPENGSSVPAGVGNYTMGFEAHEEPAGSDRVDCTNVGTSNDPYVFSSVAHGDPPTPLLKAYVGDPVVIRQVGLDEQVGDLRITGHRFAEEVFNPNGVLTDAGTAGISEKMDYVIEGGAGGDRHLPGDYLYYSGRSQELESGAWGIFRVMNTLHTSGPNALEALPDRTAPPSGAGFPTLTTTGKAPPAAPNGPGTGACPNSAPVRSYDVSIFNGITFDAGQPGELPIPGNGNNNTVMYALSSDESAIKAGTKPTVPLVIRANAGDCLRVTLHNDLPVDNFTWTWGSGTTRAGFNIGNVIYDPLQSYGAAIGYDPDTTVAPGSTRLYSYYVDKELGTNLVLNMGNESSWRGGAYGALIAEPAGSTYGDPFTGQPIQSGIFADIFPGSGGPAPFRENVTIFSDREPLLGHDIMIYYLDSDHSYTDYNEQSLTQEEGTSLTQINLWQAKSDAAVAVGNGASAPQDPTTPVFEAFPNDPVRWRFADAAGDDVVSFQVAGHSFPLDHGLTGSQLIEARTVLAGETFDAYLVGGAGGATGATGDYEYNIGRDAAIKSGDWGLFRVLPFDAAATTTKGLRKL